MWAKEPVITIIIGKKHHYIVHLPKTVVVELKCNSGSGAGPHQPKAAIIEYLNPMHHSHQPDFPIYQTSHTQYNLRFAPPLSFVPFLLSFSH